MGFRLITEVERGGFPLVERDGIWIVKHKDPPPNTLRSDLLGYILGNKIGNVPEVKPLLPDELEELTSLTGGARTFNPTNTFLVRACESYSSNDLKCQTLEEAVATELVYSTWTRRRDAHVYNRAYVDGIPMFFDHETSFLAEPQFAYGPSFFSSKEDHGHPGFWRVKEVEGVMTTAAARSFKGEPAEAYHYVHNKAHFRECLEWAEEMMYEVFDYPLDDEIRSGGYDQPDINKIRTFLGYNLSTLHQDLDLMRGVIFR